MAQHARRRPEGDDKTAKRSKDDRSALRKVKQDAGLEGGEAESTSTGGRAELLTDARFRRSVNSPQRARIVGDLQRTHGNAYVQKLLGGLGVQAKLTVNAPDDEHERQADQVAEAIVQAPNPQVQRQEEEELMEGKAVEGQTFGVQRQEDEELMEGKAVEGRTFGVQRQEEEEEEEEAVQTKSKESGAFEVSDGIEGRINEARATGQQLPREVASTFEPHLQHGLGDVRIHTDSEADDLSQQLGARAFTSGSDVFFRSGEYSPDSVEGKKLLGHELTHVVQQGAAVAMQAAETEEAATPDDKKSAEEELAKSKDQAVSSMSRDDIRDLLLQAARCQELGLDSAAESALDDAAKQALDDLGRKANAFDVGASSEKMAKDLMRQLATVQLLGGEGGEKVAEQAWGKLLGWAQGQMMDAVKNLRLEPSKTAAQDVLEKASLVQMLGGNAGPALSAVQSWKQMEER